MDRETIIDISIKRTEDECEDKILIVEELIKSIKNARELVVEWEGLLSDYQKHEIDEDTIAEWLEYRPMTFNEEL